MLGHLTRKPDGRTLILHLLNYDHQTPAENGKVQLELTFHALKSLKFSLDKINAAQ